MQSALNLLIDLEKRISNFSFVVFIMQDLRFHPFTNSLSPMEREKENEPFNNPFFYAPSPLCIVAANQLQSSLPALCEGKMFGVLVVEKDGNLGYLQAYSGQMEGVNEDEFVPPVFDYLQPHGYFKSREKEISDINRQISYIHASKAYQFARERLDNLKQEAEKAIRVKREAMTMAKALRDKRRETALLSEAEKKEMIKQSQFLKAEVRRTKKAYAELLEKATATVFDFERRIAELKTRRKLMSDHLQSWLFSHFVLRNACGEAKSVIDIFHDYYNGKSFKNSSFLDPPSGAGECCEPKLLHYAFCHGMKPLGIAMFWWGASPKTEIRHHKHFYPACNGKCKPLLTWMLKGMNVENNPLESNTSQSLDIIYEDEWLAIVNKPSGMLTIPGRTGRESVESKLRRRWELRDTPVIVHRLDMATSGLLVVAKDKRTHAMLQEQFKKRTVGKRYSALISPSFLTSGLSHEGILSIPLRPDPLDRPRQVADFTGGKEAVTHYRIIGMTTTNDSHFTKALKVELTPLTGRTHQLRVHCAHPDGLNVPILGDTLYGKAADRLYLHAEYLRFTHPATGELKQFEVLPPF